MDFVSSEKDNQQKKKPRFILKFKIERKIA